MKKPAKTREELESAIRLEMEDISDWPTDLAISVVPHEDSWKVEIMKDGPQQDADRSGDDRSHCRPVAQPVRPEEVTAELALHPAARQSATFARAGALRAHVKIRQAWAAGAVRPRAAAWAGSEL
ncbi:hypothetical protein [Bradyrhizobium sp. RDI18]|uniref:hypothetical protein n=1 Tax=Bradyrhizobium sp. RDI18 TaxID=3367400 RepID=UPI003716F997